MGLPRHPISGGGDDRRRRIRLPKDRVRTRRVDDRGAGGLSCARRRRRAVIIDTGLASLTATERRDFHLMGRIATGDREAFAELFDLHGPVVLGVLTRSLGDRAEAEEVLQETFLQVWTQARRYSPERASPRGWLLMIGRSRALDRVRSRRSSRAREEAVEIDRRHTGGAGSEPLGTARLEAAERATEVSGALATLPEEQRRCIELAYYEGLTQSQIAERLGAPLGTVKSRLLLGMRKLREALA